MKIYLNVGLTLTLIGIHWLAQSSKLPLDAIVQIPRLIKFNGNLANLIDT